jgi:hypothetical protein
MPDLKSTKWIGEIKSDALDQTFDIKCNDAWFSLMFFFTLKGSAYAQ